MLELQVQLLCAWWQISDTIRERLHSIRDDERGEVTAQTAVIVILVIASIAAGTVIATKIAGYANKVPDP